MALQFSDNPTWNTFVATEGLSPAKAIQCATYLTMLEEWNKKTNLTRIIGMEDIVPYHFADSLNIDRYIDFSTISGIADVGTGAGFPGLALKLKYPHLTCVLIEVCGKKVELW